MLLTSQVISIAFYSEREKSNKFCSEALILAWGSFTCHKSTIWDPRYYFPSEGQHAHLSRSGPRFDPRSGQVSWVRFFRGFSSPVRQMSGSFRPPRSPNITWPPLSSIISHYGRQWPEMLMRPKTSNIHIYLQKEVIPRIFTLWKNPSTPAWFEPANLRIRWGVR